MGKMKAFEATMRVTHVETWFVYAEDEEKAREKFSELSDDVLDDDTGGEVTDWELVKIRETKD